jgi:glycosyltransferase involved in cell wall biosynthesis
MINGLDLTIITPSEWLASVVKESFMKDFPVKVINNGIDLNIFRPIVHTDEELDDIRNQSGLLGKKILLGVADVWSGRKGFADYCRLASMLPENMRIVLIGLDEKLQSDLPQNILGLPRTKTQKELVDWYTLADVVLNLSYEKPLV